jgi:hypothetical protein
MAFFWLEKEGTSPSLAELRFSRRHGYLAAVPDCLHEFGPLDRNEQCSPLMSSTANDSMEYLQSCGCRLMLIDLHAVDSLLGVALLGLGE